MKAQHLRLIALVLLALAMALTIGCSDDDDNGPVASPKVYSYELVLSGPTDNIGGVFFSIPESLKKIDSTSIDMVLPRDANSVVSYAFNDSTTSWEFVVLKKYGTLSLGVVGVITTDSKLDVAISIREVCDTLGALLDPADFQFRLDAL